ncbi:hypothetical protein MSG28_008261, partial [Choristoneura fumiferana]
CTTASGVHGGYRPVVVGRNWNERELVSAALRAFHVAREPEQFELTDAGRRRASAQGPDPAPRVTRLPTSGLHSSCVQVSIAAKCLRSRSRAAARCGCTRAHRGRGRDVRDGAVPREHTVADLMAAALERFGLDPAQATQDYRCSEILLTAA